MTMIYELVICIENITVNTRSTFVTWTDLGMLKTTLGEVVNHTKVTAQRSFFKYSLEY